MELVTVAANPRADDSSCMLRACVWGCSQPQVKPLSQCRLCSTQTKWNHLCVPQGPQPSLRHPPVSYQVPAWEGRLVILGIADGEASCTHTQRRTASEVVLGPQQFARPSLAMCLVCWPPRLLVVQLLRCMRVALTKLCKSVSVTANAAARRRAR